MAFIYKDYLGDGVYALFDGFGIWLHANNHENPTDRIYLEPKVLDALKRFDKHCYEMLKKMTMNRIVSEGRSEQRPDCYKCKHRRAIPGDCHSSCDCLNANVKGRQHGIDSGWFHWPVNFDPVWLVACDSFEERGE